MGFRCKCWAFYFMMSIMKTYAIYTVVVPGIFREPLDYLPPEDMSTEIVAGMRAVVPLARRQVVGIVVGHRDTTALPIAKLKPIVEILDERPWINQSLLDLFFWVSEYYHHPIAEVILKNLPKNIRQQKPLLLKKKLPELDAVCFSESYQLNEQQQQAVDEIQQQHGFSPILLDGVTGSGKTEVYMQAMVEPLQQQGQVLLLVPEIGLTPQTIARFVSRFNVPVVALHSGMTPVQRAQAWLQVASYQPLIVIGTRSAVFAPFIKLAMIIIDEEHDLSFKQQSGLRYQARDVAVKRAHQLNIPIILGSATPSFESLHNVMQQRYHHIRLTCRIANVALPPIRLCDLREKALRAGMSAELIDAIKEHLQRQQQVLIFINRRGYAPVLLCHHCGYTQDCPHCDAHMVWHHDTARAHCHHCGFSQKKIQHCQQCKQSSLSPVGLGTQRLEEELAQLFPEIPLIRVDRDSIKSKSEFDATLAMIHQHSPAILIGTQMLTKGHHFPNLSLAAIINADGALFSVDFRSQERLAQTVLQVAGRVGRSGQAAEVILQTHQPEHPLLLQLLQHDYGLFATQALLQRHDIGLPPFAHMALLRAEAKNAKQAENFLTAVAKALSFPQGRVDCLGPVAAIMPRRQDRYRQQLLFKALRRQDLAAALVCVVNAIALVNPNKYVRWSLDVDPQEIY